jgi:glycerol-3-phosphate acyltransferase PlsX
LNSHTSHIIIAVDAMGGDFAPAHIVEGAVDASREADGRFSIVLVGRAEGIDRELRRLSDQGKGIAHNRVTTVDAAEVITMEDSPTAALRTKKNSSIAVGLRLHREGKAHAFVSAGNTGAVLSASTLILGRLEGVGRPTIGALVPTIKSPCFLVDAGANVDCKPRHLFEFAVMGSLYMSSMTGVSNPRVALLNIGEEDAKGNEVAVESFSLLKKSRLNFAGNVEGRDILRGVADVVVCDGFVGNILLKFGESIPGFFKEKFSRFAAASTANKLVALVARKGLRSVMRELDYQEHGGVPLLGVNGVSIIGHGGSTPKAVKNMIFRAEEMVLKNVNGRIQETLGQNNG